MRSVSYRLPLFVTLLVLVGWTRATADSTPAPLLDRIVAQERLGLDALMTGDLTAFAKLNADDAIFVDPHGPAGKAEVMKNVTEFRLESFTIIDPKLVPISDESGLLVYKLEEKGNSHGHEFAATVYVSSLWSKRNGEWVCLFSQETGASKPPPAKKS